MSSGYMTEEEVRIEVLKRRVEALTQERNELTERVGHLKNAYHAQELKLEMERSYSRISVSVSTPCALSFPMPEHKVERFKQAQMRGERACL